MSELFRIYSPEECGPDGYPNAWHQSTWAPVPAGTPAGVEHRLLPIKDTVRELAGNRCERCGHPYPPGVAAAYPRGEWTPCDERCAHPGPLRYHNPIAPPQPISEAARDLSAESEGLRRGYFQAQWRILTVHHLNGVKWDCRWWNLAALCQRCHLEIQARVLMERVYPFEHSEWFKPHAAGWYAAAYLGEELTRDEVNARLDELLALERMV